MQANDVHNRNPNKTYTRGDTPDSDKSFEWLQQHRMGIQKPTQPSNVSSVLPRILTPRIDYPDSEPEPEYPDEADWSAWFPPAKDQSEFNKPIKTLSNFNDFIIFLR